MELKFNTDYFSNTENLEGVSGRYCALLDLQPNHLKNVRQFFDIYNSEGNHLQPHVKEHDELDTILKDASYRAFPRAIEYRPFSNAHLIRTVQKLIKEDLVSLGYSETWSGDNFCFVRAEQSERGTDMIRVAHDRFIFFQKALRNIRVNIQQCRHVLEESELFHDIDSLINNCKILEKILTNLSITPDMSGAINENGKTSKDLGLSICIPNDLFKKISFEHNVVKTHCHLAGNAASEFFIENKLQFFVQELLLAAQLFEYSALSKNTDQKHFGHFPTIKAPESSGLSFSFKEFHHPRLLREGQRGKQGQSLPKDLSTETNHRAVIDYLIEQNILIEISNNVDNFSNRVEAQLKWVEGIGLKDVLNKLQLAPNISEQLHDKLCEHFISNASESFGNITLGEIDPSTGEVITVIVLPSPNMAGKSTSMKAIGLILQEGLMARKVSCKFAEMTIPDQIYHNFNVEDNLSEQRSMFKAQLENINNFLSQASQHSLGLFDELFNGTSSDYQLALAWAFLELCSEKKLRVIVSTHNRQLEFFSDPKGYEHIRGSHSQPKKTINAKGSKNAKTLSIGHDRKLKYGSERDSEAMAIAEEVLNQNHKHLIVRAREILEHIRSTS